MDSRIQQLNHISELLDEGKIDRFEYEVLKEELFAQGDREARPDTTGEVSSSFAQATQRVEELKARTLETLGWTILSLRQSVGGGILLNGIEAFLKGVTAFLLRALGQEVGIKSLVDHKPSFLPLPIYTSVVDAINEIASRYPNSASPYEFRAFMAAFCYFAWEDLEEAGIHYDPAEQNTPQRIFERLDVAGGEADRAGRVPSPYTRTIDNRTENAPVPSLEIVVTEVHERLGLTGFPVTIGTSVVDAIDGMLASGLMYMSGDADGFRLVIGALQKGLTAQQRKMLGYSFFNSYPAGAVAYVKAVLLSAIEAGTLDYEPETADLIRAKPAGS